MSDIMIVHNGCLIATFDYQPGYLDRCSTFKTWGNSQPRRLPGLAWFPFRIG